MILRLRKSSLANAFAFALLGLFTLNSFSSGFQLREQSPSSQGNAFAGVTAGMTDISSMYFNPATMGLFSGNQFAGGFSFVQPDAEFSNGSASRFLPAFGPISGPSSHPDAGKDVPLPSIYAMWSIRDNFKFGLSVNVPFGMGTEYESNFIGRYHALKSSLTTIDVGSNFAYRVTPNWSLGASLIARKAKAEITNAVDFATIILANPAIPAALKAGITPGGMDGVASLEGDKWGFGYKLGTTFQAKKLRVGFAYHGAMTTTIEGAINYTSVPSLLAGTFKNGDATAEMNLPYSVSGGFNYDITDKFSIQGELSRTGWSSFEELRVKFQTGQADVVTKENWKDTWFYSGGFNWKPTKTWSFRSGLAGDQSAVDDTNRTPRIPDANRTWLSAGASYNVSKSFVLDLAYTHIFVKDSIIALKAIEDGTTAATSNNTFRGNLNGNYENKINILALQARFSF